MRDGSPPFSVCLGGLMTNPTPIQTPLPQQDDKQAIQTLTEDWVAAVRTKDIARLTNMVTEDAVFLPPGFPAIRGKQGVEAMYTSFFRQFSSVEQTASLEEVEVAGDWAFAWGTESFNLVPQASESQIHMQGKGMSILRRQPDGSWKFARGINNTLPQAEARTR
jgi:uncharacterized protein (TIGR02246 family)